PDLSLLPSEEIGSDPELVEESFSCVQLGFRGSFSGIAALVFPPASAIKLVAALTGEDAGTPGLNGVMAGTLNEVGNIVINSVIGTIGNILEKPFDFSIPDYLEGDLENLLKLDRAAPPPMILLIRTRFRVEDRRIEGNIFLVFESESFDALVSAITRLVA
ncbi:MAG TPA: chemotaxis protein CheX, partial [Verrucomicrobiae bacterium]|nr:chemotaxis protein CheX [Verrucomicrobiae bacterium]